MPFVSHRAMMLPPLKIDESMQLHTIKKGTSHALCKSLHCNHCQHLFVDYRFDDAEMSRLYHQYRGADYCSLRDSYEPGYAAQNAALVHRSSCGSAIEEFLSDCLPESGLTVMDWGGDTGRHTPFSDTANTVHIYEPSGIRPTVSRAVNVCETKDFLPSYGLIVLSNVLEHIPFPMGTLESIIQFMNASSILYVEVPYETLQDQAEDNNGKLLAKYHWHEHINFFSKASLAALMERSGLRILKSNTEAVEQAEIGVSFSKALRLACALKG